MSAPAACAFPLFRERFLAQPLAGADGSGAAAGLPGASSSPGSDPALSPTKAASRMGNLRVLDLRALPRDDGPPTELRARKEKLAHFERQCSRVGDGVYVGAEWVAKSREALAAAGITHVVNCVGFLYPPYFEAELAYQTLYLQDTPGEDILCVLYDVFDFIEAALSSSSGGGGGSPGRVLIHCSQGVSRSATLAIAYLMWKQGASYDDVFQAVKASRGVANPNIGFICQLLQWHKRRHAPVDSCRLWRIAPQSTAAPQYLVAKAVAAPQPTSLDPRGAFVLQGPASQAIWVGAACPEPFVAAAHRFAQQLQRYEGAPGPALVVRQRQEPEVFWASLAAAAAEGSGSRAGSPAAPGSAAATSAAATAAELVAAAAAGPVAVAENSAYDRDFELYARSLTARTSGDSGDSARSGGRKTPREEGGEPGALSPNDRLRKQARGEERPPSPGKRRREPQWDLTLADLQPGISTDSAAAQLGKKERTLQEVTSPPALQRGRSSSDLVLHSASASDGSMTPRSRGEEPQALQQLGGSQARPGWQRQPSNLGRSGSGAGAEGGSRQAVPRLALPGRHPPSLSPSELAAMVPPPVLLTAWATDACALIERGNRLLASPAVTALQFHGIWLAALLATLWVRAGRARLRELERQRRRAPGRHGSSPRPASSAALAAAAAEHEAGVAAQPLPAVTVVLPVRGCRSHSVANWEAILNLDYGGALDFVFVLQDKSDPAHAVISQLIRQQQQQQQQQQGKRAIQILMSGCAEHTSQKIHNLLAGVRAASHGAQYILCLDDDVLLHPGLLAALVRDMEADPTLFMATGYPFDVPSEGANLLSYCALSYHLPLVVPFSVKERTEFVWGGCMLFRAAEMSGDARGILKAWEDGGYSDDLTVASKCTELQLPIYCPGYAIFPQWLDGHYSLRRWWNYLRRQLYVMDTYSNDHNRRTNHGLAAFHSFASWGVVLPATTVMLRLALWAAAAALLPTQQVYGGPGGSSYLWLRLFGVEGCPWNLASLAAFSASLAYLMAAGRWMTGVVLDLFCALNPALKRRQLDTFCWPKLWLGFYLNNAVIPLCIAYTFITRHIDWSGIRYWRAGGKVVRVQH